MPRKITEKELRFVLALAGGYPVSKAAETAGYTRAHGKALVQRESVRETVLAMAGALLTIALREYNK